MSEKLIQSQQRLRESLYDLYEIGGSELFQAGTRGLKRELIVKLETSALTPEKGEIIHYYAVNRWDEDDEFDEWAKPLVALSAEAERILGVTNSQLAHCRSTDVVLGEFLDFAETYIITSANHCANYRIKNKT
jgi:DNA polymerase III alpha subunit (gram-positive type)